MGRFACLVADALDVEGTSLRSSSGSSSEDASSTSSSSASAGGAAGLGAPPPPPRYGLPPGLPAPIAASQAAAAAEGRVELGPLVGLLTSLFFPPAMRQNYAASYAGGGLLGAVVIDTMGEFVPPKRRRMPNGTVRCGCQGGARPAAVPGAAARDGPLVLPGTTSKTLPTLLPDCPCRRLPSDPS